MKLQLDTTTMDLGDTPVENIFINDYMPQADGNFVKVYLLGLRLARTKDLSTVMSYQTLADLLGLIESDVKRAFSYWERVGAVRLDEANGEPTVTYVNLKELYVKHVYAKPEATSRSTFLDDRDIANLLSQADYYMRGTLTHSKKRDIASWIETYNMPPNLIEEAFWYVTEVQKKDSLDYVEAVVRNWSRDNIRTKEDIERSIREHDERYYRLMAVKNRIGLSNKAYTPVDFDTVNRWFDEGMSMELVMAACDRTVNIQHPNLGYVDRILRNWQSKGITDPKEVKARDSRPTPRTTFHNFKQQTETMTEDDLEALAQKKRDAFLKKLGE
ncbi:DnaD domain protein [Peptoniphilus equinus]|uniref:DnaD domain protein n=1 Tax=Peptoniphilus equinus TaxID=3016343 RepID=A0ABY7QTA7_9FIRM|nr:DnaD domain protein [Peptoniphilus equinus]WBW50012.1 DnaD domain protein [Peptoniphilus equinus]